MKGLNSWISAHLKINEHQFLLQQPVAPARELEGMLRLNL
jgi:hypothetical protein